MPFAFKMMCFIAVALIGASSLAARSVDPMIQEKIANLSPNYHDSLFSELLANTDLSKRDETIFELVRTHRVSPTAIQKQISNSRAPFQKPILEAIRLADWNPAERQELAKMLRTQIRSSSYGLKKYYALDGSQSDSLLIERLNLLLEAAQKFGPNAVDKDSLWQIIQNEDLLSWQRYHSDPLAQDQDVFKLRELAEEILAHLYLSGAYPISDLIFEASSISHSITRLHRDLRDDLKLPVIIKVLAESPVQEGWYYWKNIRDFLLNLSFRKDLYPAVFLYDPEARQNLKILRSKYPNFMTLAARSCSKTVKAAINYVVNFKLQNPSPSLSSE